MGVEFRCSRCGKLLHTDAGPHTKLCCPQCGRGLCVPQHLAALPRPDAPAHNAAAGAAKVQAHVEDQDVALGVMARIMPWVISGFFHLGVLVILGFVSIIIMEPAIAQPTQTVPVLSQAVGPAPVVVPPKYGDDDKARSLDKINDDAHAPRKGEIILDNLDAPEKPAKTLRLPGGGDPRRGGGSTAPLGPKREHIKGRFEPPIKGPVVSGAYHVVYLVDCSGSMLDALDVVKHEMVRSISFLDSSEGQTFHVLFFSDGKPVENPSRRMVPATEGNKRAAAKFMGGVRAASTTGQTNPIPGLQRAFRALQSVPADKKGKVIYLLTDGEFYDNERVLQAVRKLNAAGKVRIYTALYGSRSPMAIKTLKQIARDSGGEFSLLQPR